MKITQKLSAKLFFAAILLVTAGLYAQEPIHVVNTMTTEELVNELVDNDCAEVSNISVNGSNGTLDKSYCYFTSGPDFPFSSGIILSTGYAVSAPGPNDNVLSDGSNAWHGDDDLEQVLGINNTVNATTMEFDFVPATDHISFDYIFASEEYTSWPDQQSCSYSDGFAFLLKEAGSTGPYQNLAVIPGTDTPVQVTTVRGDGTCPSANEEYFDSFNGINSPTNFNGETVVLTAEADVTPGTLYHIKLVIADQGDALYDAAVFLKANSFGSNVELGSDRLIADNTALCDGETLTLNAVVPTATGYEWFKDGAPLAGATSATYTVTSAGEYSVKAALTSTCASKGDITIEYNAPISADPVTYFQCDDDGDGRTAYYLARMQVEITQNLPGLEVYNFYHTFADAQANTDALELTGPPYYNTAPNEQLYARVYNEAGCIGIIPVILSTPSAFTGTLPVFEVCDTDGTDDGLYTFSLEQLFNDNMPGGIPAGITLDFFNSYNEAIAYGTPLQDQYTNTVPGGQVIYANVSTDWGCFAIIEMPLVVHYFGGMLENETAYMCAGSDLDLDAGQYTTYSWDTDPVQTTRGITVEEPGSYTVSVTNEEGCEGSKTFTVALSGPATAADFDIADFRGNDNSLTILPAGPGVYEYSINGTDYQESPIFDHLPGGQYTIYINDINGCGPVYTEILFILDYPPFFTPNGDGINDIWRIPFSYFRPGISVSVFDRYGKFITTFKGDGQGWDGTYNGAPLPATDYWFVIALENGQKVKGHFSMLR